MGQAELYTSLAKDRISKLSLFTLRQPLFYWKWKYRLQIWAHFQLCRKKKARSPKLGPQKRRIFGPQTFRRHSQP